jgi:hypothetical protein
MLLICTLYYDAQPGYLITSIRIVCKYRKCSFLTFLITLLTDLLQANHQVRIGTSKSKSKRSLIPPRLLRSPNSTISRSLKFFPSSPGGCSQARTGERVDFVFDVPICPWWLACNKSVNEVIRAVKKLHFLYLQTILIDLVKWLRSGSTRACSQARYFSVHTLLWQCSLNWIHFKTAKSPR